MIDVMTRLKVHHLAEGGLKHEEIAAKLRVGVRSVERIVKEEPPTAAEIASNVRRGKRGRPSQVALYEDKVRALLEEEPELPSAEVVRRMRLCHYGGGRSAMYELIKRVRPERPKEPVVRFEGLPGEFAQFDFGEARVQFADGKRRKVVFFAGRLKYSRFVHVVIVPNQQAEALIRALIACLAAFGGSPKQWVFDNAKTIRISGAGEPLVLHRYLRDLVADMNVLPEMCAPRSGNQKGSVESLVKFTKRGFLFARKFADLEDLERQLEEWLHEVNHVRPCDATGRIPEAVRAESEAKWLEKRPVRWTPEDYPLRETRTVSVMATVPFAGTPYSAPPNRIGAPVTLLIRAHRIDMEVPGEKWRHDRQDHHRSVLRLPEHRRATLKVIHGKRKHNYFKRECLLELGPSALDFLEQLIHKHAGGSWAPHVDELFDLLLAYGDEEMRRALAACHLRSEHDAGRVRRQLRGAA